MFNNLQNGKLLITIIGFYEVINYNIMFERLRIKLDINKKTNDKNRVVFEFSSSQTKHYRIVTIYFLVMNIVNLFFEVVLIFL